MWKRFEKVFIVVALLFCAGAFLPLLNQDAPVPDERPANATIAALQKQAVAESGDPTKVNPLLRAGQILVYGVIAVLLFVNRRQILQQMRATQLLWILVALAFVSVLWSDVPAFAFRRCLNMAATTGFGLYLAFRYTPRQLLRLLGWALTVAIVCSLLVIFLRPEMGLDTALTNYGWRGIFGQKNTLGRLMSLGVLVFFFLAFDSKRHRWLYGVASLVCAGMLFKAGSATSIFAVPILLGLMFLFAISRRHTAWKVFGWASFSAVGVACGLLLFVDPNALFALMGRDATMSGRLDIWAAVLPKVMAHPWLGYGYSSFWLGLAGQSSSDLWSILEWHVPHSHNGFLDLVEELGIAGLLLFLAGFALSMKRGLQWARTQGSLLALWPLTYLSFMFLFNLTEGSILRQDSIFWVLYVATYVFVIVKTDRMLQPELAPAQAHDFEMIDGPPYGPLHPGNDPVGTQS